MVEQWNQDHFDTYMIWLPLDGQCYKIPEEMNMTKLYVINKKKQNLNYNITILWFLILGPAMLINEKYCIYMNTMTFYFNSVGPTLKMKFSHGNIMTRWLSFDHELIIKNAPECDIWCLNFKTLPTPDALLSHPGLILPEYCCIFTIVPSRFHYCTSAF